MVGGISPQYVAKDRIKDSVGYTDVRKGVCEMLDYKHDFVADFSLTLFKIEENLTDDLRTIWISVKNSDTLMDTGKIEVYVSGKKIGDGCIINRLQRKKS